MAKAKRKTGRPTNLTPEAQQLFLDAVRIGVPVIVAALHAGTSKDAVYNLLKQARKDRNAAKKAKRTPPDTDAMVFQDALKKAAADGQAGYVGIISSAARGTPEKKADPAAGTPFIPAVPGVWTAAAWMLERKWPLHWASDRALLKELLSKIADMEKRLGTPPQSQPPGGPPPAADGPGPDEPPDPG